MNNPNYGYPGAPVPPVGQFPQQSQPGQYPQQPQPGQFPQPQPGQLGQPALAQPPQYPQVPQPPMGQPQPGGLAMGLPQIHLPNDAAQQQAYTQAKEANVRFDGPQYVKFPGPNGETRWDSLPIGHESFTVLYLAPSFGEGQNLFMKSSSHFWKGLRNPGGKSVSCPGPETCLVCQAREQALQSNDPAMQQKAKNFGRVRNQFLYNVFLLENYPGHYDPRTDTMRPFILGAGATVHAAIGDLIELRGGSLNVVHPVQGRPLRLKRRKSGPNPMDIEYSLGDLDPAPLPAEFYPALNNLWDLSALNKAPSVEDMQLAVVDMGLGSPQGALYTVHNTPQGMPTPQAIQPPTPPYVGPYGNTTMPVPPAQLAPPAPPAQQQQYVPPPQQPAQPQMPLAGTVPNMAPPPVQSTAPATGYSPVPSQAGAMPVPPAPAPVPPPPPPQIAQPGVPPTVGVPPPIQQPMPPGAPGQQPPTVEQLQGQLKGPGQ